MKDRKITKSVGLIIAIILVIVIFIPLLINIAYKHSVGVSWISSEWAAGDSLNFYGA